MLSACHSAWFSPQRALAVGVLALADHLQQEGSSHLESCSSSPSPPVSRFFISGSFCHRLDLCSCFFHGGPRSPASPCSPLLFPMQYVLSAPVLLPTIDSPVQVREATWVMCALSHCPVSPVTSLDVAPTLLLNTAFGLASATPGVLAHLCSSVL